MANLEATLAALRQSHDALYRSGDRIAVLAIRSMEDAFRAYHGEQLVPAAEKKDIKPEAGCVVEFSDGVNFYNGTILAISPKGVFVWIVDDKRTILQKPIDLVCAIHAATPASNDFVRIDATGKCGVLRNTGWAASGVCWWVHTEDAEEFVLREDFTILYKADSWSQS